MLGSLTRRMAMFCIAGVMALTLVGAGGWFWGQRTGMSHAVWEARADTEALAMRIMEANVIGGLIAEDTAAVQTVDRLVSGRDERIVGLTLSSVDGHAVYSKNPAILGTTTPLGETALQSLQAGQPSAELWTGRDGEPVLRVHQPTEPPGGGEALLLQADYDYQLLSADGQRLWRAFAPVTLGTLLALGAVWMCLGWFVVRRPGGAPEPFEPDAVADHWLVPEPDIATRAFQAPDPIPVAGTAPASAEPQAAAPVPHSEENGWLGELRGGTAWPAGPFTHPVPEDNVPLPGALRAGPGEPRPNPRPTNHEPARPLPARQPEPPANAHSAPNGNGTVKSNGCPNGNGKPRCLETALSGLLLPLARQGVDTRLDLPAGLRLPNDTEELLLRAAEQAVRNTVAHGQAHTVKVRLDVHDHRVELTVDDDGSGFNPEAPASLPLNDQLSLSTLTQLAANAGGALRVRSAPNSGTRLHLDLPTS